MQEDITDLRSGDKVRVQDGRIYRYSALSPASLMTLA
jgi:hypothetical protein